MSDNARILMLQRFPPDQTPHGGVHRTEQLTEIFSNNGIDITYIEKGIIPNQPILDRVRGVINSLKFQDWEAFYARRLGGFGRLYRLYEHYLGEGNFYNAIIWESTNEYITPLIAKKYNIPLIAFPHNLEAFWKARYAEKQRKNLFSLFNYLKLEIKALQLANRVFTISFEEQFLLRNFNIRAELLPYYPPNRLVNFYSNIRNQRQQTIKNDFLIIGSAINPFTVDGIYYLVDVINTYLSKEQNIKVDLIGYQTETLKSELDYPWLNICGTVTQEQLQQHLLKTKALLIYQSKGLGALTKIPEMLIAGVPIIANRIAARSATQYTGVYIYDTPEDLAMLLQKEYPIPPIPTKPENSEQLFISTLLETS